MNVDESGMGFPNNNIQLVNQQSTTNDRFKNHPSSTGVPYSNKNEQRELTENEDVISSSGLGKREPNESIPNEVNKQTFILSTSILFRIFDLYISFNSCVSLLF